MYSLSVIKSINARAAAAPKAEATFDRHCSFATSFKTVGNREVRQVVLHSAKHRSTGYIEGAAALRFLVEIQSTNAFEKRDSIIERYFSAVPHGKQKLVA